MEGDKEEKDKVVKSILTKFKFTTDIYCLLSIFFLTIYCCLLPTPCLYGAFEETGTGARPVSMGNAFSAFSDSVYSIYYNPSGLGFLTQAQLVAEYTKFYQGLDDGSDISNGHFAFGIPLSRNYLSVGFSYQKLSFVDVYSEDIMRLGFGIRPINWLGTGITFKLFSQEYKIEKNPYYDAHPIFEKGNNSSTFDFDFGFCFHPFEFISFGLCSSNVLQSEYGLNDNSKVKLARNDKLGIMYSEETMKVGLDFRQINYFYGQKEIKTETKQDQQLNIGVEKILKFLSFRAGFSWGINYQYKNISAGLGVNFSGVEFDYGWVFPLSGIEGISGTHYFSLLVSFGKSHKKVEQAIKQTPVISETSEKMNNVAQGFNLDLTPVISTSAVSPMVISTIPVESITEEIPSVSTFPVVSVEEKITPSVPSEQVEISEEVISSVESQTEIKEEIQEKEHVSEVELPKEPEVKPEGKIPVPVIETPKPRVEEILEKPLKEISVPKPIISGPKTHKVKPGDTLISLAEKYYQDKRKWTKIYKANEDKIQKGTLKPDTVLIIP